MKTLKVRCRECDMEHVIATEFDTNEFVCYECLKEDEDMTDVI